MFRYHNVLINYQDTKVAKEKTIVYLHGWGQNIAMMEPIAKPFQKEYRTVIVDLPGHGKSSEPQEIWTLNDFVEMLNALFETLSISNPILIGHSFGGKIALLYASKYPVEKLVLLASPFKASSKNDSLKLKMLRTVKKLPGMKYLANYAKRHIGSTDYRNASPLMRDILVKHINQDLQEDAKKIKCPTLIIWGTKDNAVPLEHAYDLEKLIPNSGLVIYENATHYAYLEDLNKTIKVLNIFIKSKE